MNKYFAGLLLIATAGCGFKEYKDPSSGTDSTQAQGGSPSRAPITSNNPPTLTATFTQVFTQIIQPQCLACHGSGASPDLSSFGSFATNTSWIVPGNPSGSAVFDAVQAGRMPKGGAVLSGSELSLISGWIQSGAQND